MTISSALTWWLAALLVAMLEVSSGSFYLLAVALGLVVSHHDLNRQAGA